MSERERRRDREDRPRGNSRSRSPRRRESAKDDGQRDPDRNRERDRPRFATPPRKRRDHSRSRSRSRSRERSSRLEREQEQGRVRRPRSRSRHRRRRSRSASSSDSGSSDRHKKRRKDRHHRRSRSRDRKERKKDKKDKKKKQKGSVTSQWGKYGIINESDLYNKGAEFQTWLVEERKINPEVLSKDQTKKEFAHFVEDYNTATLPHEKFYNMDNFERRMSSMRNGETLPIQDGYDPDADLLAHSSAHKKPSTEKETYMSKEQLLELRRVQAERAQVGKMKLMGMDVGQTFGVRMDGSMFDG